MISFGSLVGDGAVLIIIEVGGRACVVLVYKFREVQPIGSIPDVFSQHECDHLP